MDPNQDQTPTAPTAVSADARSDISLAGAQSAPAPIQSPSTPQTSTSADQGITVVSAPPSASQNPAPPQTSTVESPVTPNG